jgi:hypothetical protein
LILVVEWLQIQIAVMSFYFRFLQRESVMASGGAVCDVGNIDVEVIDSHLSWPEITATLPRSPSALFFSAVATSMRDLAGFCALGLPSCHMAPSPRAADRRRTYSFIFLRRDE